jgi:hypothetical protein
MINAVPGRLHGGGQHRLEISRPVDPAVEEPAMHIPTLIEPIPTGGFRASCGGPFDLSVDGRSREEALELLRARVKARLASGAQVIDLDVADEANPWVRFAGIFRDDPLFDEWQEAIAENRRKIDADPDRP